MQTVEGGRLCAACDRVLVDFTDMPAHKLLQLQRDNDFKLCGKYTRSQVEAMDRHFTREGSGHSKLPWLVAAAMGGLTVLPTAEMLAQHGPGNPPLIIREQVPTDTLPSELELTETTSQVITISGRVIEAESGEPLPFVNISLDGMAIGTISDFDGNYELQIPADSIKGETWLNFYSLGYEPKGIVLVEQENVPNLNITLEVAMEPEVLGMMVGIVIDNSPKAKLRRGVAKLNPAYWVRKVRNKRMYKY